MIEGRTYGLELLDDFERGIDCPGNTSDGPEYDIDNVQRLPTPQPTTTTTITTTGMSSRPFLLLSRTPSWSFLDFASVFRGARTLTRVGFSGRSFMAMMGGYMN